MTFNNFPAEMLLEIMERLPDVFSLYNFTRACTPARNVFAAYNTTIFSLPRILSKMQPQSIDLIQETADLRLSEAALRNLPFWKGADALSIQNSCSTPVNRAHYQFRSVISVIHETERLADAFMEIPEVAASRQNTTSVRTVVVRTLLQLQLCATRMQTVQLEHWLNGVDTQTVNNLMASMNSPSFTEQLTCEIALPSTGRAIIKRTVRSMLSAYSTIDIKRMRVVMDELEKKYCELRRHGLRPLPGLQSLMSLLYDVKNKKGAMPVNLRDRIYNVLNLRHILRRAPKASPGTTSNKLMLQDSKNFDNYYHAQFLPQGLDVVDLNCEDPYLDSLYGGRTRTIKTYLEQFRPFLGLSHGDLTPVWTLVQRRGHSGGKSRVGKHGVDLRAMLDLCETESHEYTKKLPNEAPRSGHQFVNPTAQPPAEQVPEQTRRVGLGSDGVSAVESEWPFCRKDSRPDPTAAPVRFISKARAKKLRNAFSEV